MAMNLFPKTQIMVQETTKLYTAYQSTTEPDVFTCEVSVPANSEETDKVYTLEVYTNNQPTGVTTTVTVVGTATEVVKHAADTISANPAVLDTTGGSNTITVKFKVVA